MRDLENLIWKTDMMMIVGQVSCLETKMKSFVFPIKGSVGNIMMTFSATVAVLTGGLVLYREFAKLMEWDYRRYYDVITTAENINFDDVIGCESIKKTMLQHVNLLFQNDPKDREVVGLSKGFICSGPSGVGKTLMIRALAGEIDKIGNSVSRTHCIELKHLNYVGDRTISDIIDHVINKFAPCVLFIDEFHHIPATTLQYLLTKLDGLDTKTSILGSNNSKFILIGCTTDHTLLGQSLLRSNRMDKIAIFHPPEAHERRVSFEKHLKDYMVRVPEVSTQCLDIDKMSRETAGLTHSDINSLMRDVSIRAYYRSPQGLKSLMTEDFDQVIHEFRVKLSSNDSYLSEEESIRISYHEAGHCLIAYLAKSVGCPLKLHSDGKNGFGGYNKFNLISKNPGIVDVSVENDDKRSEDVHLATRNQIVDFIASLLGGTMAELVFCGSRSTACSQDFVMIRQFVDELTNQCLFNENDLCGLVESASRSVKAGSGAN